MYSCFCSSSLPISLKTSVSAQIADITDVGKSNFSDVSFYIISVYLSPEYPF